MNSAEAKGAIEASFRKQVQKDPKVKNAYLLVYSEKAGVNIKIAEGSTGDVPAHPDQPNYVASVGKLFTSVLVATLFEKGLLSFDDSITKYLDTGLLEGLHVHKGKEYTRDIQIRNLLNHTSGLDDNFLPLVDELIADPAMNISLRETVIWAKNNLKAQFPPGEKFRYSDTNYQLLGLIVENITGEPFHKTLRRVVFEPLEMKYSFMLHNSEPIQQPVHPTAHFYINGVKMNDYQGYGGIDYSGGGVVAPTGDLLKFMKALVNHQIVSRETLEIMKNDKVNFAPFAPGIHYGYGIWQFVTVPIIMPRKFNCWGVAGINGAFLFYHPVLDAYLVGCFNDSSYMKKSLRFMLNQLVNRLWKAA